MRHGVTGPRNVDGFLAAAVERKRESLLDDSIKVLARSLISPV